MRTTSLLVLGCAALLTPPRGAFPQDTTHTVQPGAITGVVRARETEVLLANAIIQVLKTRVRVETDAQGVYALTSLTPGVYRLRAQRLGYAPADTTVLLHEAEQLVVDFRLAASAVELNPVVAIGYGTVRKKDLTGSASSVNATELESNPVERAEQALAGRVPGMQIQTTNAQPDAELRIRVRGGNSLSASNAPLVVIDGVIGADLSLINPKDIETFDILKDASATAIFGARGGNGVIMVTTKSGQGPVHLDYSVYTGVQNATKHIDVLDANQFALLYMRNPTRSLSVSFDTLNSLPTTDWQNVVYQAAPIQNHELRISGSSEDTRLMFSANWYDQQGVLRGSDVARGSLRFNLDQNVGTRFRLGTRVTYSRTVADDARVNDGYGSAGGPVTMETLRFAPTIPVYDANGNFSGPLLPGTNDNPMAIIDLRQDQTTRGYGVGTLFGEYDLVRGLTLRTNLSYTSNDFLEQQYTSRKLQASLNQGQANVNNSTAITWMSENTATLHRTLGKKHDFTLLGGWSAQQTDNGANNAQGVGFTSDILGFNRLNVAQTVTGGSSASRQRLLSFFGRLNYAFAGKYLLTATLRDDGSSKFAVNNKWARFPSAALAWRASSEPFLHRLAPTLSDLKLRLSAGESGSEAIGSYQSLAAWSVGSPYAIGTTTYFNGATINRFANPNLHWETTTQYDAGLDLGLFGDRVTFTVDGYDKTTSDLLYNKLLPYFTGFNDYITNIGKIRNRGLELALDTRPAAGALQIRVGGTFSLNRSKVLDLGGDQQFFLAGANSSLPNIRDGAIVRVGEPLGNFYGYVFDGIFQSQAEVDASNQGAALKAQVGGEKLRDLDGDGKVDPDHDRTILGNAVPRYLFGLTGSIAHKGLSLSWTVRGALGFQVVNLNRLGMETPGGSSNMLTSVLNYWSPTNPSNTMTGIGIGPSSNIMSSRWVEDGSFVRLQNVTVQWELPSRWSGHFGMQYLRFYASAQNIFTATRYSWYDPEVSSRGTGDRDLGWDDSSYPGVRTITVGTNLSF